MDPWGTPVVIGALSEVIILVKTDCFRLERYEENQFRAEWDTFRCISLFRIRSCLKVLKALLKSMKVARVDLWLLRLRPMSSTRVDIASTVDSPGRNPKWQWVRSLLVSRKVISLLSMICSSTLPGMGRREICLRSVTFVEFRILGMGITMASFLCSGTGPDCILRLHR